MKYLYKTALINANGANILDEHVSYDFSEVVAMAHEFMLSKDDLYEPIYDNDTNGVTEKFVKCKWILIDDRNYVLRYNMYHGSETYMIGIKRIN